MNKDSVFYFLPVVYVLTAFLFIFQYFLFLSGELKVFYILNISLITYFIGTSIIEIIYFKKNDLVLFKTRNNQKEEDEETKEKKTTKIKPVSGDQLGF